MNPFANLPARIIALIVAVAVALAAVLLAMHMWRANRDARAKADLSARQSQAAIQSGKDAVGTVSAASDREAAVDGQVSNTATAVRAAPDANSADRAGREGLCAMASYRSDP